MMGLHVAGSLAIADQIDDLLTETGIRDSSPSIFYFMIGVAVVQGIGLISSLPLAYLVYTDSAHLKQLTSSAGINET